MNLLFVQQQWNSIAFRIVANAFWNHLKICSVSQRQTVATIAIGITLAKEKKNPILEWALNIHDHPEILLLASSWMYMIHVTWILIFRLCLCQTGSALQIIIVWQSFAAFTPRCVIRRDQKFQLFILLCKWDIQKGICIKWGIYQFTEWNVLESKVIPRE